MKLISSRAGKPCRLAPAFGQRAGLLPQSHNASRLAFCLSFSALGLALTPLQAKADVFLGLGGNEPAVLSQSNNAGFRAAAFSDGSRVFTERADTRIVVEVLCRSACTLLDTPAVPQGSLPPASLTAALIVTGDAGASRASEPGDPTVAQAARPTQQAAVDSRVEARPSEPQRIEPQPGSSQRVEPEPGSSRLPPLGLVLQLGPTETLADLPQL